jgi:hypothetical protein
MRKAKRAAIDADRDRWMKQAFAACFTAVEDLIDDDGPIRPGTPIGRLTESEWGWVTSTVVWAWISTRSEQAATEGWDIERVARTSDLEPDPWSVGAVASILPKLAEVLPDLDWTQPVGDWSQDSIVEFLMAGFRLMSRAHAARDAAEAQVAGEVRADVIARELNAASGGPLMTAAELDDMEKS